MYLRRLSLRSLEYFQVNEDCKREESTSFFFFSRSCACLLEVSFYTNKNA